MPNHVQDRETKSSAPSGSGCKVYSSITSDSPHKILILSLVGCPHRKCPKSISFSSEIKKVLQVKTSETWNQSTAFNFSKDQKAFTDHSSALLHPVWWTLSAGATDFISAHSYPLILLLKSNLRTSDGQHLHCFAWRHPQAKAHLPGHEQDRVPGISVPSSPQPMTGKNEIAPVYIFYTRSWSHSTRIKSRLPTVVAKLTNALCPGQCD